MERRLWEVDALRGLMLLLMTVTHMPTGLAGPLGQPLGFVSAAEGFVLLSGFMAGMVYTGRAVRGDPDSLRRAMWSRAGLLYLCHTVVLMFLFSFFAMLGLALSRPAITNLLSFFLLDPLRGLWSGLALIYNPPLFDILPLYVMFMLVSPFVIKRGLHRGWGSMMAISIALWLGAQFDLGGWLYTAVARGTGLPVPVSQTGSFETLAWQLVWMLGLWMGSTRAAGRELPSSFPRWMLTCAAIIACTGFFWRHGVGQVPFGEHAAMNLLFDKWHVGPLRVLSFLSLLVLALRYGPAFAARVGRSAPVRALSMLGRASLPVFCAHQVIVLLALLTVGDVQGQLEWWQDVSLLICSLMILWGVAAASHRCKAAGGKVVPRTVATHTMLGSGRL